MNVAASVSDSARPLLEVTDLTVHHGQLRALSALNMRVMRGEVAAIIGANGAGKSTLMRTIAGLHPVTSGSIHLDGRDVTGDPPEQRVQAGIALVPEGRRLFPTLSVEDNLRVAADGARPGEWSVSRIFELFSWMPARRRQPAAQLSGGEQQAVAIGRALVTNPRVLLLDELSLGLSPAVVRQFYGLLPRLVDGGMTVVLVEQDVSQAMRAASHVQCLLEGRVTLEGRSGDLTAQAVEAAYFGLARV